VCDICHIILSSLLLSFTSTYHTLAIQTTLHSSLHSSPLLSIPISPSLSLSQSLSPSPPLFNSLGREINISFNLYHIPSHPIQSYHIPSYHIISYPIPSYHIISHHIISRQIASSSSLSTLSSDLKCISVGGRHVKRRLIDALFPLYLFPLSPLLPSLPSPLPSFICFPMFSYVFLTFEYFCCPSLSSPALTCIFFFFFFVLLACIGIGKILSHTFSLSLTLFS
jgi:hypothetical protein